MPEYKCHLCGFFTKYKTRYTAHLNTKKHQKKLKENKGPVKYYNYKNMEDFTDEKNQINNTMNDVNNKQQYKCLYCNKSLSNNSHMHRHMRTCKLKNINDDNHKLDKFNKMTISNNFHGNNIKKEKYPDTSKKYPDKYPDSIQKYPDISKKYPDTYPDTIQKYPDTFAQNNLNDNDNHSEILDNFLDTELDIDQIIVPNFQHYLIDNLENDSKKFVCPFCNSKFTKNNNLSRHKNYRCKKNPNVKKIDKNIKKEKNKEIELLKEKLNKIDQKLTTLNPINMTTNYNDIKILNIYTMKPVDLLNKFCKNNPPSDGVFKYLEKRGIKSCEEDRLLTAHKTNNLDFVASEIDKILKDCNKELIESTNILENTCDGILFSNDGSCRKHIVKGPTDWLYMNDEKILDKAVSQILDKVTLKYGIQMNYVKKMRAQIIKKIKKMNDWATMKNKIINQVGISKNMDDEQLILNNLDNCEIQKRIEKFLNDFQKNESDIKIKNKSLKKNEHSNILSECSYFIDDKSESSDFLETLSYKSYEFDNKSENTDDSLFNYDTSIPNNDTNSIIYSTNKIIYDYSKQYLEIVDCGKKYLMDDETLEVFDIKDKKYVGRAIHEEGCPINHINNKITSKCWKYVEYI